MLKLFQLTKRNASLYFRDRMAVFSSLLSMIIIIGLMLIFLGDMYIDGLNEIFESIPDAGNKTKDAKLLVLSWTTAGIIPINAVMVTLSSLTSMISDKTSGKINSIYTAPISRTVISASYIASAWITSVIVCILTLAISEIYFFAKGMEVFSAAVHLELFGMIAVNSFTYSAIMYLLAALIKSESAWGAIGTIIGTLVGFLGGVYLPIGQFSGVIASLLKCTPIIYSTVMFRQVMTDSLTDEVLSGASSEVINEYKSFMGIDIDLFGKSLSAAGCIAIMLIFGIAFMAAGTLVTGLKKKK